ncbi:hypothetical protein CBR_g3301 [Chara braunii]|uniref:Reverse transcriptase domain-containing protein n=1 Tax=Chara braunii TaxID=69332 RepID=A0A388KFF4_CHABU|nr:hypothetical protein CBR_g3301 [Chara braunii]|eukprot:GBG68761.1 hypothetical protein CBR_g3301 [Chara braunii]
MDDILVFSKTHEYHVEHIEWVLHALKDVGFKVALEKSEFFLSEISFLGYIVTVDGLKPDPRKVAAVQDAPAPVTLTQVRAFLGMASYYRRFIKGFAGIAKPLTNLLKKEEQQIWTPECEARFQALKEALTSAPVLARPDPTRPFALYTDWQPQAISAVLTQHGKDGREHVIEYASKTLSQVQANYEACKVPGSRMNHRQPEHEPLEHFQTPLADRLLRHRINEERQLRYDIQQVNVPAPGVADLAAYSLLCDRLTYAGVYVDVTQLPGREMTLVFIKFRALQVAPNFMHSVATFIGDLTILQQENREPTRSFVREYAVEAARLVARVHGRSGHRFTAHEVLLRRAEDGPIALYLVELTDVEPLPFADEDAWELHRALYKSAALGMFRFFVDHKDHAIGEHFVVYYVITRPKPAEKEGTVALYPFAQLQTIDPGFLELIHLELLSIAQVIASEEEEIQPRLRTATAPRRTYNAVVIPDYIAQRTERLDNFPEERPLRPPSSYSQPAPPKAPKKTPKRKRRHPSPGVQGSRIGGGEEVIQPARAATLVKETIVPLPPIPRVPDLNLDGVGPSSTAAAGGGSRMGFPDPISRPPVLTGPLPQVIITLADTMSEGSVLNGATTSPTHVLNSVIIHTHAIIHERLGGVAVAPFLPDTDVKKSVGGAQVDIRPQTSRRRTTRKNKSSTGTKPQSTLWSSKSASGREDRLKLPSRRCLRLMRDVYEVRCLPGAASVPFADTDASIGIGVDSEVAMDVKGGGDGEQRVDSTATAADGAAVTTLPEECFRKESTAGACQASPISLTGSSSPMGAASVVLVKNGIKLDCTFASAADLLRSLPNHAYTTTRTTKEGTLLMCWDRHMLRLFDSRNRLHLSQCTGSALSSMGTNVAANDEKNAKEEEEEEEDFACFKSKVEASVHVAMEEALLTKREGEGEELNVVILAGIGEKKGDVYVNVAPLRLLKEDVASLPAPVEVAVMGPARTLPDVKYTDWVKIRRSLEKNKPASVSEVILSNDGRTLLEGMVTNFFVIKRRRQRSENSQEVSIVMRDDDGDDNARDEKHGYGGNGHDSDIGGSGEKTGRSSSSFPPSTTSSSSSYSGSLSVTTEPCGVSITDIELQTATLVEGVLPGIIRSLILDICAERGISVRETAPSLDDRAEWMGGFLTNSLHPLRPISSIYLTSESTWSTAMDSWSSAATTQSSSSSSSLASWSRYELPAAHANFTKAIAKLVWERALQESIHVKALLSS